MNLSKDFVDNEPISLILNTIDLDADKRQAWVTMVSCPMGLNADRSRGLVPKDRHSSMGLGRGYVEARRLKPKTYRPKVRHSSTGSGRRPEPKTCRSLVLKLRRGARSKAEA